MDISILKRGFPGQLSGVSSGWQKTGFRVLYVNATMPHPNSIKQHLRTPKESRQAVTLPVTQSQTQIAAR